MHTGTVFTNKNGTHGKVDNFLETKDMQRLNY